MKMIVCRSGYSDDRVSPDFCHGRSGRGIRKRVEGDIAKPEGHGKTYHATVDISPVQAIDDLTLGGEKHEDGRG
jgi:hypothetical protein